VNLVDLEKISHGLAGAGASYGFDILTDLARKVEHAARLRDAPATRAATLVLIQACRRVLRGHPSPVSGTIRELPDGSFARQA
jgi:hypothetical protein